MIALVVIGLAVIYLTAHLSSGATHHRYRKAGYGNGHRRPRLWWSLGRGFWISVPGPLGLRISRRL